MFLKNIGRHFCCGLTELYVFPISSRLSSRKMYPAVLFDDGLNLCYSKWKIACCRDNYHIDKIMKTFILLILVLVAFSVVLHCIALVQHVGCSGPAVQ
jgi:hypothetical protein